MTEIKIDDNVGRKITRHCDDETYSYCFNYNKKSENDISMRILAFLNERQIPLISAQWIVDSFKMGTFLSNEMYQVEECYLTERLSTLNATVDELDRKSYLRRQEGEEKQAVSETPLSALESSMVSRANLKTCTNSSPRLLIQAELSDSNSLPSFTSSLLSMSSSSVHELSALARSTDTSTLLRNYVLLISFPIALNTGFLNMCYSFGPKKVIVVDPLIVLCPWILDFFSHDVIKKSKRRTDEFTTQSDGDNYGIMVYMNQDEINHLHYILENSRNATFILIIQRDEMESGIFENAAYSLEYCYETLFHRLMRCDENNIDDVGATANTCTFSSKSVTSSNVSSHYKKNAYGNLSDNNRENEIARICRSCKDERNRGNVERKVKCNSTENMNESDAGEFEDWKEKNEESKLMKQRFDYFSTRQRLHVGEGIYVVTEDWIYLVAQKNAPEDIVHDFQDIQVPQHLKEGIVEENANSEKDKQALCSQDPSIALGDFDRQMYKITDQNTRRRQRQLKAYEYRNIISEAAIRFSRRPI